MTKLHAGGKHRPANTLLSHKTTHIIASTKGTHKSSQDVFSAKDQKVEASDQDAKNTNWSL